MASHDDKDGTKTYSVAQKSLSRSCTVTACVQPQSPRSYIARSLALFMLGPEGLLLAETASQAALIGQVGVVLGFDDAVTGQWTENFLLGENCGPDLILSCQAWNSFRLQHAFCMNQQIGKALACTIDDQASCSASEQTSSTPLLADDEDASSLYSTDLMLSSWSTHESNDYPPSSHERDWFRTCPEIRMRIPDSLHLGDLPDQEGPDPIPMARKLEGEDARQLQSHACVLGQGTTELPRHAELVGKVWAWDSKHQKYYARGRSMDDKWYWYPEDLA